MVTLEACTGDSALGAVVVTASAPEQATAHRGLDLGALGFILHPLDQEQTVRTIRLALWHSKLRHLIVRKDTGMDQYRQHMAQYPGKREEIDESFHRTLVAFDKTISSIERTILKLEEGRVYFSDFAPWVPT